MRGNKVGVKGHSYWHVNYKVVSSGIYDSGDLYVGKASGEGTGYGPECSGTVKEWCDAPKDDLGSGTAGDADDPRPEAAYRTIP